LNKNAGTPLHSATRQGYIDVAQLLLKNKADINIIDKNNQTPLAVALANGHDDIALLFDPNLRKEPQKKEN